MIAVNVENHGTNAETFNLTVHANTTIVQTEPVTLTSGNYTGVSLLWNTIGWAKGNYAIWACVEPVAGETHVTDNALVGGTIYVGVPGDINGDGIVDIYDAILRADRFSSHPASPDWNPNADINSDNLVDIYDAIILAGHFNQHYP